MGNCQFDEIESIYGPIQHREAKKMLRHSMGKRLLAISLAAVMALNSSSVTAIAQDTQTSSPEIRKYSPADIASAGLYFYQSKRVKKMLAQRGSHLWKPRPMETVSKPRQALETLRLSGF